MQDYMADEAVAVLSFDKNTGLIKNVVSCDPANAVSQAKYFRLIGAERPHRPLCRSGVLSGA